MNYCFSYTHTHTKRHAIFILVLIRSIFLYCIVIPCILKTKHCNMSSHYNGHITTSQRFENEYDNVSRVENLSAKLS